MSDKLGEFLVSLGFSVEGVDKLTGAVKSLKDMREVFASIREPFQAFNETLEAMGRIGEMVKAPFEKLYDISSEAAHAADELGNLSKKLGVSTKDLQEWGYVADVSGSSAEEMTMALRMLNRDIAQAANGSKEAAESYKKLGVAYKDATTGAIRPAGDVMQDVLEKLSKIPDEATRAAKGMEFFARGGINIRALFGVGIEELETLRAEFQALGGQTSEVLIKLGDEQKHFTKNMQVFSNGVKNAFAEGFQPMINGMLKWFNDLAVKYGPQIRAFLTDVGDTLAQIGFVVGGAIDTFVGVFKLIYDNIDIVLPLVAIWKADMIVAAISTAAAWALAALPFIALFLVLEDFFGFLEGKDSVIGEVVAHWAEWTEQVRAISPFLGLVMDALGGVGTALKAAAVYVRDLFDAFESGGLSGLINELKASVGTALDYYKAAFSDFFNYLGGLISTLSSKLLDSIVGPLKATFGSLLGGGTTITPGSSSVGASSTSISNSNASANVTQNINAAPGMNERELANHSQAMFKEAFSSELRAAYPAAAPGR